MSAVAARLRQARVIAVIRADSSAGALACADALIDGGITALEVTSTTPDANQVIASLGSHAARPLVGAGTVVSVAEVEAATAAGARFIVSPGTDAEVIATAQAGAALAVPGALTPTEVMRARRLGCDVIKLFPGSLAGPAYLRALTDPFPDVQFVPTGGVTADNLSAWFVAGAAAVGAGGSLCSAADIARGDFSGIRRRAREFAQAAQAVG